MKISVALCTYNGEKYIADQIRSILNQTHPVDEIVISDDSSEDETIAVIERVLATSKVDSRPKIQKIINKTPLGVTKNFEQAIRFASGELIFLSDQDDFWAKAKVKEILEEFESNPDLLLVNTNALLIDDKGTSLNSSLFNRLPISRKDLQQIYSGDIFPQLLKRNIATGATMAFRSQLKDTALPFPPELVHDEWLALVAASTKQMKTLPDKLTFYRQHSSNQIGAKKMHLGDLVQKLFEPSMSRNLKLTYKAKLVCGLFSNSKLDRPKNLYSELAVRKLVHEQFRSRLPNSRIRRIIPIAKELFRDEYFNFGLGTRDMLRDLFQPKT